MANPEYRLRLDPEREALWRLAAADAGYNSVAAWLKDVGDMYAGAPFDPLDVRYELYLLRQEVNRFADAMEAVQRLETPPAAQLPDPADVANLRARLNGVLR
jgi:hypothetical protein